MCFFWAWPRGHHEKVGGEVGDEVTLALVVKVPAPQTCLPKNNDVDWGPSGGSSVRYQKIVLLLFDSDVFDC